MTTPTFDYDVARRLDAIEALVRQRNVGSPGIQILGNGIPFFPGGFQVGSGAVQVSEPAVLPVPTNLTATPGSSFDTIYIDVSWTAATGFGSDQIAAYLVLVYKTGGVIPIETTVNSGITSTRIQPLEPNTQYTIRVAAVSKTGRNSTTITTTVTTGKDNTPPAAPTGVTVAAGVEMLMVTWNANTERDVANGAGQYRLIVSTSSNLSTPAFDGLISGTIASVPSLVAGTPYYVGLRAIDSSGNASPLTTPAGGPWVPLVLVTPTVAFGIGGGNVVLNSGFEDIAGLVNWTTTAGCSRSAAQFHGAFGLNSLLINTTGDLFAYQDLTLSTGTWTISCWSMASSVASAPGDTTNKGVGLRALTQSGTTTNFSVVSGGTADGGNTVLSGKGSWAWKRLALKIDVTSATAVVRVQLQRGISGACTGLAYFDEVQAEQGSTITAYAPRPDELSTGTVTQTVIADNSITSPKLVAGSVIAGKLAANSVGANEIIANSITANNIATNAIIARHIQATQITSAHLSANSVTAGAIASNSIRTDHLRAHSVEATNLAVSNALAVGQHINSTNWVPATSGWHIDGSGNAEFNNVAIRGSQYIGGSINIAGIIQAPHPFDAGSIRLAGNVEIGDNYSGRVYSGDQNYGMLIASSNGGPTVGSGFATTYLTNPLFKNGQRIGFFDTFRNRAMLYVDYLGNLTKSGPEGGTVLERSDQAGGFATKSLILQTGPLGSPGNDDIVGLSMNAPARGRALILQMVAGWGEILEVRTGDNLGWAPIKTSEIVINSETANKSDIVPLASSEDVIMGLTPIQFKRPPSTCTECRDTGKLLAATTDASGKLRKAGTRCLACKGKPHHTAAELKNYETGHAGFTAEQVAELAPEAASYKLDDDGEVVPDGIAVMGILAHVVAMMQKQEARIAELEAR